ncbi:MAG: hypothetical protein II730_01585, partial [Bacteroidales bacterium]|nr:hypothetical protein [Bacteroidales bacterium]
FKHINDYLCKDMYFNPLQEFHPTKCPTRQGLYSVSPTTDVHKVLTEEYKKTAAQKGVGQTHTTHEKM